MMRAILEKHGHKIYAQSYSLGPPAGNGMTMWIGRVG